nr:hypothetical protein [Euryarchaeota archaeon]
MNEAIIVFNKLPLSSPVTISLLLSCSDSLGVCSSSIRGSCSLSTISGELVMSTVMSSV